MNLKCECGHSWERHHHGCVMNIDYAEYPLALNGVIAQECEQHEVNGNPLLKDMRKACRCGRFKPIDKEWIRRIAQWKANHPKLFR